MVQPADSAMNMFRRQVAGDGSVTLPVPFWEKVTVSPGVMLAPPSTVALQLEVTPTEEAVHASKMSVAIRGTVTLAVPELAVLFASPGYDAWMVTGPGVTSFAKTEQLVPERTQVAGDRKLTAPVPPVWEKAIVSPEIVPEAPDTVAVHRVSGYTTSKAGVHETEVVVGVGVVVAVGEYWNVVVCDAEPLLLPQVALTRYLPAIQVAVPPATMLALYAPVEGLTASD